MSRKNKWRFRSSSWTWRVSSSASDLLQAVSAQRRKRMSAFRVTRKESRPRAAADLGLFYTATSLPQLPKPAHLRAISAECEWQNQIADDAVAGAGVVSFGMRVAMDIATKSRKAPRYHGAPGRFHPFAGSTK